VAWAAKAAGSGFRAAVIREAVVIRVAEAIRAVVAILEAEAIRAAGVIRVAAEDIRMVAPKADIPRTILAEAGHLQ
jgi:hypothetical protein